MKKNKIVSFSIGILLSIAILSAAALGGYGYGLHRDQNKFEQLIQKEPNDEEAFRAELQRLHTENGDLVGWVHIPDTRVDYPVMQTPENGEYYLRRNFSKDYSLCGTLFLDQRCSFDPQSDHFIVYGHNMKDGSMFADLLLYRDEDFWKAHGQIEFYMPDQKRVYEIIAVIEAEVYTENTFDCYAMIDAASKETFDTYITNLKKASLYLVDIPVEYGDHLLTLSTCSYHTKNGRLVVVGRWREEAIQNVI